MTKWAMSRVVKQRSKTNQLSFVLCKLGEGNGAWPTGACSDITFKRREHSFRRFDYSADMFKSVVVGARKYEVCKS